MTLDDVMNEWLVTRERIAVHLATLCAGNRIHRVGGPAADAADRSVERLEKWRQEIDETMIEWLMPK